MSQAGLKDFSRAVQALCHSEVQGVRSAFPHQEGAAQLPHRRSAPRPPRPPKFFMVHIWSAPGRLCGSHSGDWGPVCSSPDTFRRAWSKDLCSPCGLCTLRRLWSDCTRLYTGTWGPCFALSCPPIVRLPSCSTLDVGSTQSITDVVTMGLKRHRSYSGSLREDQTCTLLFIFQRCFCRIVLSTSQCLGWLRAAWGC